MKKMLLALAVSAFACFGAHAQWYREPGTIKFYVERSPFEVTPNVTITASTLVVQVSQFNYPTTGTSAIYQYPVLSTSGYTGIISPAYYWVAPSATTQVSLTPLGKLTVKNTAGVARSLYVRVGVWKSNAGGQYLSWAISESYTVPSNQSYAFTIPLGGAQFASLNWPTSPGADAPTAVLVEVMEN